MFSFPVCIPSRLLLPNIKVADVAKTTTLNHLLRSGGRKKGSKYDGMSNKQSKTLTFTREENNPASEQSPLRAKTTR